MQEEMVKVTDVKEIPVTNEQKITSLLATADKFFVGVAVLNGTEIQHYIFTKEFPLLDLLPSWLKIRNLAVEEMQEAPNSIK